VALQLFRIDERLLHGQVIVGWGMRLRLDYYVVVDESLAASVWEQDLYSAGLPPEERAFFVSPQEAIERFVELDNRPGRGAVLTRGTEAMRALAEAGLLRDRRVNVGGLHAGDGRKRSLDYVFLSGEEVDDLVVIEDLSGGIAARDLPSSRDVPLRELLHGFD
jgi:PTS system mannose-specific IIB component/fructoselysine and glucoselysine-specific PTS system IIB component